MTAVTTRWWWIRHAPVINHGGRIYGHTDVPADTSNGPGFSALAARLPARPQWLRTPLGRTTQTLSAILAARAFPGAEAGRALIETAQIEPALMEQNFGAWQGLTYAEVEQRRGAPSHRFWISPAHERPDQGESFADVVDRVGPAVARLSAQHAGRDLVVVAHGGTIRAALAVALGLEPEAALSFCVDNLSLTRIDHLALDGGRVAWRVECVNLVAA